MPYAHSVYGTVWDRKTLRCTDLPLLLSLQHPRLLADLHAQRQLDADATPTGSRRDAEMLLASRANEMHALDGDVLVSTIQLSLLCNFCCFYENARCRSLKMLVGSQRCAHESSLLAPSTRTIRGNEETHPCGVLRKK